MKMEAQKKQQPLEEVELTGAENELYDRQIRLWGLEFQKRLSTAKVFISGLGGLGAEITKNIILSGVNSVTLHDDQLITEEDNCAQFLAPRSALGQNRAVASIESARALNPMVKISADTEPLSSKEKEYFSEFDVVIVCGQDNDEILRINYIRRDVEVKFYACEMWGMFGYYFADLQTHKYVEEVCNHKIISNEESKAKKRELVSTTVQHEIECPSYEALKNFDTNSVNLPSRLKRYISSTILLRVLQEFRKRYLRNPCYKSRAADCVLLEHISKDVAPSTDLGSNAFDLVFGEISPAAAIIGGVVAQEVTKTITGLEAPHCNLFIFDPRTGSGFIQSIGVKQKQIH